MAGQLLGSQLRPSGPSGSGASPRSATSTLHASHFTVLVIAAAAVACSLLIFFGHHRQLGALHQGASFPGSIRDGGTLMRTHTWNDIRQLAAESTTEEEFLVKLLAQRGARARSAADQPQVDQRSLERAGSSAGALTTRPRVQTDSTGGAPRLTPALARSVAVNNTLVVAVANYAVLPLVRNLAQHLGAQGYSNFMVGATDRRLGAALVREGIQAFALYGSDSEADLGVGEHSLWWGTPGLNKLGQLKVALAQQILSPEYGLDLLMLDTDVAVVGDVLGYFASVPQADVLIATDLVKSTIPVGDEGLELPTDALDFGTPVNMGIMYLRRRPATVRMVDVWLDMLVNTKDPQLWDQGALNLVVKQGLNLSAPQYHPEHPRVLMCMNRTLALGVLPASRFLNGHTGWVQRLHEVQRVAPLMYHATHQFGQSLGKYTRLREAMLFHDPPEYWTGDVYVAVNMPEYPSLSGADFEQISNRTERLEFQFQGLETQMQPIYAGIGLAYLFNRSIILPRVTCYCDRHWNELDGTCRSPGAASMPLPFTCPMDYVLNPLTWTHPLPSNNTFIPRWRESSFLDNPRCPPELRRDRLRVLVDKARAPGAPPEERWTAQDGVAVVLPPGLTDLELQDALRPYNHIKIWWFADAEATFKGFVDDALQFAFQERTFNLHNLLYYWRDKP